MCEQKTEQKKAVNIINVILFVLFIISLVPHLIASYKCVVGYDFIDDKCQGLIAWWILMLLAFYDPFHNIASTIMVASIIYQAIFLIYQLIFKPAPYLRRLIRITFIIAIIVVFVPLFFVEMII